MGGLSSLEISSQVRRPANAVTQVYKDLEIHLMGLIDPEQEKTRLLKKREKLEKDLANARDRLENENFIKRAPEHVVAAEKQKLAEISAQVELIEKNLADLNS